MMERRQRVLGVREVARLDGAEHRGELGFVGAVLLRRGDKPRIVVEQGRDGRLRVDCDELFGSYVPKVDWPVAVGAASSVLIMKASPPLIKADCEEPPPVLPAEACADWMLSPSFW